MYQDLTLRPWKALLPATLALLAMPIQALALGTPANTVINNTAQATYNDYDGTPMTPAASPVAKVTVSVAPAVQVTPTSRSGSGAPKKTVYYPLTVRNNGNGPDSFTLSASSTRGWTVSILQDKNANGYHESSENVALTTTGSIAADTDTYLFIAISIPRDATGVADTTTVRVTSSLDSSVSATATATTSLTTSGRALTAAWSTDLGTPVSSSPIVADGVAYIGGDDGHLFAVRATGSGAGSMLWKFPAGSSGVGAPIRGRPTYSNGVIYFGTDSGAVYAINPDGTQRWASQVSSAGTRIQGAPAVVDTTVYVASSDAHVYALSTQNGAVIRRSSALSSPPTSSLAIPMGNFIWFGCQDGSIQCLSPDLGLIRWKQGLGSGAVQSSPSVDFLSGVMVIGSPDGGVNAMNSATGAHTWGPVPVEGGVTSSAWIEAADGNTYITGNDHRIYAFRTDTGATVSGYPFAPEGMGMLKSSPVVLARNGGSRTLYAGSDDGQFLAIPTADPTDYAVFNLMDAGEPAGEFISSAAASGLSAADVVVVGCTNGKVYAFPLQ